MQNVETIYLGGGCFWCIEAVFRRVKGVVSVTPGYAGGELENPTYYDVVTGKTGHAEVVKVSFDNDEISLKELLDIFWKIHDPTTLNRQGNDVGTQYRSIILYTGNEQKAIIEESLDKLKQKGIGVVTEVKKFDKFYEAEIGHKEYYEKHPNQLYCRFVIDPKIRKFKDKFSKYVSERQN
ncbi:MAG: peptide-methionine (S)-S-oxide reductase MsrA [Candidatus Dojkabacteria bacterium]|nr:peptide-methionine (S)-S-oxide reductase MsrA [Candidatus Dojkabacteria bacterium]